MVPYFGLLLNDLILISSDQLVLVPYGGSYRAVGFDGVTGPVSAAVQQISSSRITHAHYFEAESAGHETSNVIHEAMIARPSMQKESTKFETVRAGGNLRRVGRRVDRGSDVPVQLHYSNAKNIFFDFEFDFGSGQY
jgi:hypothetical protein